MKLDDIYTEWNGDCEINFSELGREATKIPKLHAKYYRMFSEERLLMKRMQSDHKLLMKDKTEWYNGTMDIDRLKELGWKINPLKVLRSETAVHVDADQAVTTSALKLALQTEKVDLLESIIKTLANRGYLIKTAVDFERFKMGA